MDRGYCNMSQSFVQILDSRCVLVFFNDRRYLFNCGEGLQRLSTQHAVRLSQLDAVFLTRLDWRTHVGGLPGMICTLGDAFAHLLVDDGSLNIEEMKATTNNRLHLMGPVNTSHFVGSLRAFLKRRFLAVSVSEFPSSIEEFVGSRILFQDDTIKVSAIELASDLVADANSAVSEQLVEPTVHEHVVQMFGTHCHMALSDTSVELSNQCVENETSQHDDVHIRDFERMPSVANHSHRSLCYVIQGPRIAGKFNASKAKELLVPRGPLYGQLVAGESISCAHPVTGVMVTVHPEQCVDPSPASAVLVILDVPNESLISSLKDQMASSILCDAFGAGRRITVVIHLVTSAVRNSLQYQQVIDMFPNAVQHLWSVDDSVHTALDHQQSTDTIGGLEQLSLAEMSSFDRLVQPMAENQLFPYYQTTSAYSMTRYPWSPIASDSSDVIFISNCTALSKSGGECIETENSSTLMYEKEPSWNAPAVTCLGTGAAIPGKYRNVSSTLVDYGSEADFAVLLDCGEGTIYQILRRFGPVQGAVILKRTRLVFISHLHADHQLGFLGLVPYLARGACLIASSRYFICLEEYADCVYISGLDQLRCIAAESLEGNACGADRIHVFGELQFCVEAVPVDHCPYSYGYVFGFASLAMTFQYPQRLGESSPYMAVYSGDTRPCELLADRGRNSFLLVHECTFESSMVADAERRLHSTLAEAIDVAVKMNLTGCLVLTHFSQRYARQLITGFEDESYENYDFAVIPAFVDLLTVHVDDVSTAMDALFTFVNLA